MTRKVRTDFDSLFPALQRDLIVVSAVDEMYTLVYT